MENWLTAVFTGVTAFATTVLALITRGYAVTTGRMLELQTEPHLLVANSVDGLAVVNLSVGTVYVSLVRINDSFQGLLKHRADEPTDYWMNQRTVAPGQRMVVEAFAPDEVRDNLKVQRVRVEFFYGPKGKALQSFEGPPIEVQAYKTLHDLPFSTNPEDGMPL